jgi:hypothetical protein
MDDIKYEFFTAYELKILDQGLELLLGKQNSPDLRNIVTNMRVEIRKRREELEKEWSRKKTAPLHEDEDGPLVED